MYARYSLTLMLTHDCNLRCSYCYMGKKSSRVMTRALAFKAIGRAVASLQVQGELELAFFGGEPLLESALMSELVQYARSKAGERSISLRMGLTTNGTITTPQAWDILLAPDVDVAISCDGIESVHDRHRRCVDGRGSWHTVMQTIRRLVETGREFRIISVVRPDTLDSLCESALHFRSMGVRHFEPSLDLWTHWTDADEDRLQRVIADLADIWRDGLPDHGIGWFSEKAIHLAKLPMPCATRCGFGDGAVAVAPSGNFYPCERLIGEDRPDNPIRIPGHASDGEDFLHLTAGRQNRREGCSNCAMEAMCNTFCRCSNYARTGDPRRPDRLLCRWNQACLEEAARVLKELVPNREL